MRTFAIALLGYCIGTAVTAALTELLDAPPGYVKWLFAGYSVVMLGIVLYRPVAAPPQNKS